MDIRLQTSCSDIDWDLIPKILKQSGMFYFDRNDHKKSFENSYAVVFVFYGELLIGFGRAISDGVFQAVIYEVVVLPEYQRKKVGTAIVNALLQQLSGFGVILFSSPGKEDFYRSLNFRKMKTGMALFQNSDKWLESGYIE